jgi:hypothetical protein
MSICEIDEILWKFIETYLPPQKLHNGEKKQIEKVMNCF